MAEHQALLQRIEDHSLTFVERLEERSMDLLADILDDVYETGSDAIKAVPQEDLKACLFMYALRVGEFLKARGGGDRKREVGDLKMAFLEGAMVTVDAIDECSEGMCSHSRKVARYAGQIAARTGLKDSKIEEIEYAALIHNIGRINEKRDLVESNRRLSDAELQQARDHCVVAAEMLRPIHFLTPIVPMVRHHHTRYDGTGYPGGVTGDDLPLGARIIAIADAYNAMRSDRPYRKALSREDTLNEIDKNAGKQFDPKLVPHAHDMWEDHGG